MTVWDQRGIDRTVGHEHDASRRRRIVRTPAPLDMTDKGLYVATLSTYGALDFEGDRRLFRQRTREVPTR
jgi:hypothetical protein